MISRATSRADECLHTADFHEYRHLRVWQRAMELARKTMVLAEDVPGIDPAVLSGLRRTAMHIPGCIAAGYSRSSHAEYIRMLFMARGDLATLDTQCMLAHQMGVLTFSDRRRIEILIIETVRLIDQMIEKR